jgi:subtilase family serine protease
MYRRFGLSIVVAGVVGSALAMVPAAAVAAPASIRVGSAAVLPRGAKVEAKVSSTQKLQLTVALEPQDPGGLAALARAVSSPGSALFRQYLPVAQFAQRFGATPAQVATVRAALQAEGLTVGATTANNLTIPVTGTAAQVEKAFSVSLSQVRLPTGRTAYANAQAPVLPQSAGRYVQGVIGLDNVALEQPQGERSTRHLPLGSGVRPAQSIGRVPDGGGPQPCGAAQTGSTGGYSADVFATAYGLSSLYSAGDLGAGQTVALFEEQPYNPTDVATYQACYGTSASVSNVDVDGGPGPYSPPPGSGDGESALDIETVIGLAPRANILVYQGPFGGNAPVDIISAIVSQDQAKVISSSYGVCEALTGGPVMTSENTLLQEAAVQGQSFFISSGDSGSSMCYQANKNDTSLSVLSPASEPFATGVGGTTLYTTTQGGATLYSPGDTPSEGVWNDGVSGNRASGTGGGISSQWGMPSYQSGAASSLGVINSNSSGAPCGTSSFCREVPDVSADADPQTGYSVYTDGAWGSIGGTSAATPLWAAFTALANASAPCRGLALGFVNPALYQIAGSSYLNNFTDVTNASPVTGLANNDALQINNNLYPIATGYDMATGLGTPLGGHLAATLCGLRAPVYTVGVANPGTQTSVVRHPVFLPIQASDSGGAAVTYSAAGLPAGLAINPSTGAITGTPVGVGTSVATVVATDGFTNTGLTQFRWSVVSPGPPSLSRPSLGGVPRGRAKLSFTVGAGRNAPAVGAIVVSLPSGLAFSRSARSLTKGIVVKGANGRTLRFRAKVSHGVLTITLSSAQTKAQITIAYPAISVSASLETKVKRRKVRTLAIAIRAIDKSNTSTRITLRTKVA